MAFCVKCGKEFDDGAQFCPACGTRTAAVAPAKPAVVEKVGSIRKCPACGEPVESFQIRCSNCGHEFRGSSEVSSGIQKFVDQINEVDKEISAMPSSASGQSGWTSWSNWQKIGWVLLNLALYGIPLIFYLIKGIFVKPKWKLSPIEQRKQGIISNFIVPNNREDITETMLFTAAKIREAFGTYGSIGKAKAWHIFWTQVWISKSQQIIDKARLSMADEAGKLEALNQAVRDGEAFIKKDKKMKFIKLIVIISILVIVTVLIAVSN